MKFKQMIGAEENKRPNMKATLAAEAPKKGPSPALPKPKGDPNEKGPWKGKMAISRRTPDSSPNKRCWCGKSAHRYVCTLPNVNYGRGFYKCKQEGSSCRFYEWDEKHAWDDLELSLPQELKSYLADVRDQMFAAANSQDYITAGRLQEQIESVHAQYCLEYDQVKNLQ